MRNSFSLNLLRITYINYYYVRFMRITFIKHTVLAQVNFQLLDYSWTVYKKYKEYFV